MEKTEAICTSVKTQYLKSPPANKESAIEPGLRLRSFVWESWLITTCRSQRFRFQPWRWLQISCSSSTRPSAQEQWFSKTRGLRTCQGLIRKVKGPHPSLIYLAFVVCSPCWPKSHPLRKLFQSQTDATDEEEHYSKWHHVMLPYIKHVPDRVPEKNSRI